MTSISFQTRRRVEFADTDMAGIAHFTSFLRYMEEAEHAFLRQRGLSVVLEDAVGMLGFPKLSASCRYHRPVRFEQILEIETVVRCEDQKRVEYDFQFFHDGEEVAEGRIVVAFCRFPPDRPPYAIPIRDEVLDKLTGERPDQL